MASSVVADGFYARYSRSDAEYFNSVGMSILIKNRLVFVPHRMGGRRLVRFYRHLRCSGIITASSGDGQMMCGEQTLSINSLKEPVFSTSSVKVSGNPFLNIPFRR